ncbi:ABC transporter substrate-binding protein [Sanguibacter sp. HDW7]|uniref:ABC transporter substrate-binding protein n=1 Tax=Sanguibacter sp. HDW7 TaxID=2714931 RepID=UPI00197E51E7|nr:ABC transporter substrate-binding protein [Sanguibacter sp. HDW7]
MKTTTSRLRRRSAVAAAAAVLALALTACGSGGTTANPTSGGSAATGDIDKNATIEAGISYSLGGGFDPMTTSGAVTVAANWHTLEGLTELDGVTRVPYEALAGKITEDGDSAITVALRDGAVFHDGSPVTADDVVFSYERVLDPANNSLYRDFISFVDKVEKVDDTSVKISFKFPFSLYMERLSAVKIVPKAIVEKDLDAFTALPTGTGPYKITSATPDDKITFERFDKYTGPKPAQAAGMTWNLLSDPAARVTALQSGTVHAIEDVPLIDLPTLQGVEGLKAEKVQAFGLLFMMFNTKSAPFDDVRVRQAFHYALDKESLVKNGMLDAAEPATSFLPSTHPNYHEASTQYAYDPEKAKALLAEAGVSNLSITLLATDTGWVADVLPLIQQDLEKVGVKVTLDVGQSSGQYTKVDAGDYQVMVAPGDPSVFGNDVDILSRWWFGDNVWTKSRTGWAGSEKFTELTNHLDKALRTSGDAQQTEWNDAMDIMSEEVTLYPLFHRQLPTAWSTSSLKNFSPISTTGLNFLEAGVVTK